MHRGELLQPIHVAALLADAQVLASLLRLGVEPMERTSRGRTAWQIATAADDDASHWQVLDLLEPCQVL